MNIKACLLRDGGKYPDVLKGKGRQNQKSTSILSYIAMQFLQDSTCNIGYIWCVYRLYSMCSLARFGSVH